MTPFKLFRVKPEERIQAVVLLTVIVALNALFIYRMHDLFMQPGFGPYWKAFERELHLSGYDPLTYLAVTDWDVVYQVYRHPLLSFLIWPFWLLNQGLTALFGVNCVQYIVALPLMVCSFYSYIFLYRIHREVIELERWDATLLTAFYFSFAYILLSVIVPDHFTISMFLLLITLYISGVCIQKGREFRWWQSAIFFYVTAGVTLSNGIKVFLSGFFVNLKDFFRPKYLLLALAGIWTGRRRRFLWLCLSCFGVDMFIHLILGFGLNEIFIMAPHFMFVLPIATAYLFKSVNWQWLRLAVIFLTIYLLVYNGYLLTDFLLSPIRTTI